MGPEYQHVQHSSTAIGSVLIAQQRNFLFKETYYQNSQLK
jgi:hypothetical protein